jgi:hypothetical protein
MNAHKLGSFFADFLEGFLGDGTEHAAAEPAMPAVIPMDSIRAAVREVIEPLIAADDATNPTAEDLDRATEHMGVVEHGDPMAEAIRKRVADIHAAEEQRAREDDNLFDVNMPNGKPWMAPSEHA